MRRRIWAIFIEIFFLGDTPFVSDRSEDSLMKRFAWIQEQTTKFNAAYDKIKKRKVSVLGVADMLTQSLVLFKMANEQITSTWSIVGGRSSISPSGMVYMHPMTPTTPESPMYLM
jgi:hypothetical protein